MDSFLISERRLAELAATRQGRISLGGFNFQAAYAAARLASMLVRRPVLDLPDFPTRLRYDWGEDLDECCENGRIVFTQCKRIANIGQPAGLSSVLQSFAAKWMSVPESQRTQVSFRLVCTDARFRVGGRLADISADAKADTERHFVTELGSKPGDESDRANWQGDADAVGQASLFASLWERTDALFIPPDVVADHPAGPLLPGERAALVLLLEWGRIGTNKQTEALHRLRRIVHDNLIEFDPANNTEVDPPIQTPRVRDRADVAYALATCQSETEGALPFEVVDRTFLTQQRQIPRRLFVARQPDWADVVHGHDETVKFVERSITPVMRDKIITDLVEPLERGTDRRLRMLFVVGAPGSGKTTLTRRIAAMLVDEGRIVVADAGLDVREPVAPPEEYASALEKLAAAGRPVILLLDDPLYGDSPWIDVLQKLTRPGLKVAVLSPCPKMLFDRHQGNITFGVKHHHDIGPPTESERADMARFYGRATSALQTADEFLVIAMEAAAGIPFDEIMRRLWLTLNDGKPIVEDDTQDWDGFVWMLRAFMTVCFFHRAYVPCPEPILRAVLDKGGMQAVPGGVVGALSRLRDQSGWKVFKLRDVERQNWSYQGLQVATGHQRIAQRAWELRPMKWWSVGDRIIEVSLVAPQAMRLVGQLAARLCDSDGELDKTFAVRLVDTWLIQGDASRIETRHFCDLATSLHVNGHRQIACRLTPLFQARAIATPDGWLAASQLCYLTGDTLATQAMPAGLDLNSVICAADFSIAPKRATDFFRQLPKDHQPVFRARILASFDGGLEWKAVSYLLAWLLHNARQEMLDRQVAIQVWLRDNPHDTSVRTGYLGLLSKHGLDTPQLQGVMTDTEAWLRDNPHDTSVRNGYLGLLSKHGLDKAQLQRVMEDTEAWLKDHPHDGHTRNGYLGLLSKQGLDKEQLSRVMADTEAWLKDHPHDSGVRNGYLGLLSKERLDKDQLSRVMADTEAWLKDHPHDTNMRTAFDAFIRNQRWFGDHSATTSLADLWPSNGS